MNLQSLLGIELPIIQAPMAGVQGSALAVAVIQRRGMGSLRGALLGPDALSQELAAIRAQTVKPFNVNFFCHTRRVRCPARGGLARHACSLLRGVRHRREHECRCGWAGGHPSAPRSQTCSTSSGRQWSASISACRPPELLARVRSWGSKVFSSATTVDEARWLEARGVDAIIAPRVRGWRPPGHVPNG